MIVYADHTHLGRHVTGLERITIELFAANSLSPIDIVPVTAGGTARMVAAQTFGLAARLLDPSAVLLCPGFPPSPLLLPFADRVIPYIHDLFLISRPQDLNMRAKLYMAPPFSLAVRRYPHFLVNSLETRKALAAHCRKDANIVVYRPKVRNVFDVKPGPRIARASGELRLLSLGTVEPRKNYLHAARILSELRLTAFPNATLDIIGRQGWGDDWDTLDTQPGVTLCGYQSAAVIRRKVEDADAVLCTSHEEGLGLPLLELQYAGHPVIAPDAAIFREVLDRSGILIDRADPVAAAQTITAAFERPNASERFRTLCADNLTRWNALADDDRDNVIDFIASMDRSPSRTRLASSGDTRRFRA